MEQIYEIQRVTDTFSWDKIPVLNMEHAYLSTPESVTAFGQICASEKALFVHLWVKQVQIRAEEYGLEGLPYKDSCLEFFFCPEEENPEYFNFEFNLNKCLYLGIGKDLATRQRILLENVEEIFKPVTKRTQDGWEIYYQIPYAFIYEYFPMFSVYEGKIIRGNCYSCSDLSNVPYYRSWRHVSEKMFTFHCPECFGRMKIMGAIV